MKKLLKSNIVFIVCFAICWLILFGAIIYYDKTDLHLLLNSFHSGSLDILFSHLTIIAQFGAYVLVLFLLFKFYRYIFCSLNNRIS